MRGDSTGISAVVVRSRSSSIKGQMLRLSEHREVAIYLRDGDVGIADFIDGRGELVDVVSWFRFNCGSPANAYVSRRLATESAKPLSGDLVARIEALHRPVVTRRPRTLLGALRRLAALLSRSIAAPPSTRRFHRQVSREAHPAR